MIGRNVTESVKISLWASLVLGGPRGILFTKHLLFHSPLNWFPIPWWPQSQTPTAFSLVQDDINTSFSLTIFATQVYGFPNGQINNWTLWKFFFSYSCLMSVWFLDQLEEPRGTEEMSSSPALETTFPLKKIFGSFYQRLPFDLEMKVLARQFLFT